MIDKQQLIGLRSYPHIQGYVSDWSANTMAMPYRKNLATGCMRVIDRTTLGQRQHNAGNLRYILRNRLCIFLIVVKSSEPDEIDQASPPASRPSIHFSLGVISLPIIQLRTAFLSEEDHKDGSEVGGNYKGNAASLTHMNDSISIYYIVIVNFWMQPIKQYVRLSLAGIIPFL